MIWHLLEVWLMVVATFVVGCVLGAYVYGVIANSRLVTVQGIVADEIGDVLDGIKARLGLGAAWRPNHQRSVERPIPPARAVEPESPGDDEFAYDDEPAPDEEDLEFREEEAPAPEPVPLPPTPSPKSIPPRQPVELPMSSRVQPEERLYLGADPERAQSAMAIGDDGVVPMRPAGLSGPRGGVPDNLTRIRGIGGRNEELLNSLGIFHFGQIAAWTPGEVRWIGQYLAFPERIERDDWVGQAMVLASGGETGFEKSAERRRRRRRLDQQAFLVRQVALGVATVMKGEAAAAEEENDEAEPPTTEPEPDGTTDDKSGNE